MMQPDNRHMIERSASFLGNVRPRQYRGLGFRKILRSDALRLLLKQAVVFLLLPLFVTACGVKSETQRGPTQVAAMKYRCPMHPQYGSDKPGECPVCFMALVPITAAGGMETASATNTLGRVAITISPEKQQLIGVRFSEATHRELIQNIRLTARIEHDETRLARIAPRYGGWVRQLAVNATGQNVEKGDLLLTVYSPELLAAESEYLLAYDRFQKIKDRREDSQFEPARRLLESSRRRLLLWEVPESEILAMEQSGQVKDDLALHSPVAGHVISKPAVAGRAFMPGETLFEIGEMDPLWLRAAVYEYELPLIKVGQKAQAQFPALGNLSLETAVDFIYPHIDVQTRRAEIRLTLDNPQHRLRPEMWGTVIIQASVGSVLSVPASALIDTGLRHIAFVQKPNHHLEPRAVTIGLKTDDYVEVRSGLEEGDQVLSRALFLVDSESQLQAAIAGMTAGEEHQHP
jgi:membrane fusion protein, copper/silver efflux system